MSENSHEDSPNAGGQNTQSRTDATESQAPAEQPGLLQRSEKRLASTMRQHLAKRGNLPTQAQTVNPPMRLALNAITSHNPGAEQSPTAMLMQKAGVTAVLASHTLNVASRSFAHGYLDGRDKAKNTHIVSLPKAAFQDPSVAQQFRRDLNDLANHQKTWATPNKPFAQAETDKAFAAAMSWPGGNVKMDLKNFGIKGSPELTAALNTYFSGGRDQLVKDGLLAPLQNSRTAEASAGGPLLLGTPRTAAQDREDAVRRGQEFRRQDPPRQLPAPRRESGYER